MRYSGGAFLAIAAISAALASVCVSFRSPAALSATDMSNGTIAMRAVTDDRWSEARSMAARLSDPVALKLVVWYDIIRSTSDVPFSEIAAFMDANPDWPWPITMQTRAEEAINDSVPPRTVIAWFERHPPQTGAGLAALARALRAVGDTRSATEMARRAWTEGSFSSTEESNFLNKLGDLLKTGDHKRRLNHLLWENEPAEAKRMLTRVDPGTRAVATARMELHAMRPGVDAAIDRVPTHLQGDPGLVYERIRWRRRNDFDDSARSLLNGYALDAANPPLWWNERSLLARRALADGAVTQAYRTAAGHANTDAGDLVEAEWLAGWIALRFLHEPQTAFRHFQNAYKASTYPISLARGAYWSGRAAEAGGKSAEAAQWYRTAAAHSTVFYGQLAALKLAPGHRPALPAEPVPTPAERTAFRNHELTRAVEMLAAFGQTRRIRPFILRLAELNDSPGWKVLAAQLAASYGRADLGVFVGKQAYRNGDHLTNVAYPTIRLPTANGLPRRVETPLVLGVIRQESAFRADAVSPAGARGLMQLMPATAKRVAGKIGTPYSKSRLVTDPTYNVTLGRSYLSGMLVRFDGNYILSLAAYNAGPRRSERWRRANGAPGRSVDEAVDWIEAIPFSETRNYVQRTLENLQIYRTKLSGNGGPTLDRDLLR